MQNSPYPMTDTIVVAVTCYDSGGYPHRFAHVLSKHEVEHCNLDLIAHAAHKMHVEAERSADPASKAAAPAPTTHTRRSLHESVTAEDMRDETNFGGTEDE
ncbi:MAG: hypothetical protein ACOYBW_08875 [Fluviibacter phosphoraccumulans]